MVWWNAAMVAGSIGVGWVWDCWWYGSGWCGVVGTMGVGWVVVHTVYMGMGWWNRRVVMGWWYGGGLVE